MNKNNIFESTTSGRCFVCGLDLIPQDSDFHKKYNEGSGVLCSNLICPKRHYSHVDGEVGITQATLYYDNVSITWKRKPIWISSEVHYLQEPDHFELQSIEITRT